MTMLYSRQMSAITLTIPDELAERLRNHQERLPEILELGLRELRAGSSKGFEGAAEVLEFLAGLPSPEAILGLRPSQRFERHMRDLLERNRLGELTPQEEELWERYEFLEHLVRIAKTKACMKLGIPPRSDA
jgi:hypothetical protein